MVGGGFGGVVGGKVTFTLARMRALVFLVAALLVLAGATELNGTETLSTGVHAVISRPIYAINYIYNTVHETYESVRGSMSCSARCGSGAHKYIVENYHDRRGCSDKAVFDHERMDNADKIREGRRLTGRVDYDSWNGVVCEEEDTSECAPSFKYVAAFSIGCDRKEANGTVTETYRTYSYKALAKAMDHFM